MGFWTLIKCISSFGAWAFGRLGSFNVHVIVVWGTTVCLVLYCWLLREKGRWSPPVARWSAVEVNPGPSVHCFLKQSEFSGFFSYCTYSSTTQPGRKLFPNKKLFFHLSQVCLLYLSAALYQAEACVLMCKRRRAACNLFFPFQHLILHNEIQEVKWIRDLLTTAFWKCVTVSNAQWVLPSICSLSFTYVPTMFKCCIRSRETH